MNKANNTGEWVSKSCEGERCSLCGKPASNKIAEVIMHDDPNKMRHELTQYVCREHFERILMPYKSQSPSTETGQQELIKYVNESFNETARIYGKVKRVAQYGGSIFIIFEDDSCYRLQWQSYRNDTVTLDASQPQEVGQDATEIYLGDLQANTDRILRDKGASNKDVYDAINDVVNELKSKYKIHLHDSV